MVVDDDVALGGGLDTDLFQSEVLGVGLTADCPQENVGLDGTVLVGVNGQIAVFALNFSDLGLTMYLDPGMFHPLSEDFSDVRVESPEDVVMTDEEMGLCAERIEDTCEFYGDVTSTDDDDSFRLVLELEEPVRGDTEVSPGNFVFRGDDRMTTDGDADVMSVEDLGFLTRVRDLDLGGREDGGVTVEEVDALLFPVSEIDTAKPFYVGVALELEGGPVELWFVDVLELVPYGLTELVGKICGMPHQFLWDASWKTKEMRWIVKGVMAGNTDRR